MTQNPYVGPRTFGKADRRRFFGREKEARDLVSLVISERLVLFYAESGAGKSSLLNTRLIPRLVEEEGFVAMPVGRVSGELPPGVDEVDNIFVFNLILSVEQSEQDPNRFAHMPLATFLQHLTTEDGEHYFYQEAATEELHAEEDEYEEPPHILVIDQFEEIINTHLDRWQEREGFFEQLNRALLEDPLLWVVLTLREDYVAALRPYSRLMFNNMRARFYMKRMEAAAAQEAIEQPAAMAGLPFDEGVADILVNNLRQIKVQGDARTQPGQYVEPVQLQVVCYQLWENLRHGEQQSITQQDLEELGDVDTALSQYYEQAVATAIAETQVSEVALRNWFDRQLITEAETRGIVYQGETETAGMRNDVVRVLSRQFLVRPEIRAGGTWYELVHDRFVTPILQANQTWRARQSPLLRAAETWDRAGRPRDKLITGEELKGILATIDRGTQEQLVAQFLLACEDAQSQQDLAAAQAEAEEQARRAEAQARAARRLRVLSIALGVVAVIAFVATIFAIQGQIAANAQRDIAVDNAAQAKANAELAATNEAEAVQNAALAATRQAEAQTFAAIAQENEEAALANAEEAKSQAQLAEEARQAADENAELARENAVRAEQSSRIALAQSLAAQAPRIVDLNNNTELATLLALEALRINEDEENEDRELVDTALRDVLSEPDYNTVWNGHNGFVVDVAFDPTGRYMASVEANGSVLIWDTSADSSDIRRLPPGEMNATQLAFAPDGTHLAVLRYDGAIVLWDVSAVLADRTAPPEQVATYAPPGLAVTRFVLTTDGRFLIAYARQGQVLRWDLAAPDSAEVIYNTTDVDLINLAVSRDGRFHAAYARGTVVVRDLSTVNRSVVRTFNSGSGVEVTQAIFMPDNSWLVTADATGRIAMWDLVSTDFRVRRFSATFPPPIGELAVSADGGTIALIVSEDLSICLLDANDPDAEVVDLKGHNSTIRAIDVSPANNVIASASDDRSIRLWELGGTDIAPEILRGYGAEVLWTGYGETSAGAPTLVTFSQKLNLLDDSDPLPQITEWDLTQSPAQRLQTITLPETARVAGPSGVLLAGLYPPRQLLATANLSHTVSVWSFAAGDGTLAPVAQLADPGGAITAFAFSADGQLLAAAAEDEVVYVWNLAGGAPLALTGVPDTITFLAFSPNRQELAAADDASRISLWHLAAPDAPLTFDSQHVGISALAFRPDGWQLASSGYDDIEIRLWDLTAADPAAEPQILKGHNDWIFSIAYSPDGDTLASGSWDRTIRIWDLRAENPNLAVTALQGHGRQVRWVAFSPDSGTLASASEDQTARQWIIGIQAFADIACDQVRRNLSLDEWERYLRGTADTYARTCDNRPVHSSFMQRAADLARRGDTAAATALLERALAVDPDLDIDPAREVERYVEQTELRALLDDTLELVVAGEVTTAVANLAQIRQENPTYAFDYFDLNLVCWYGALWNAADEVIAVCDEAVALAPVDGNVRDSRGVARALLGDYDGAAEDFAFYVEWLQVIDEYEEGADGREAWITALQNGENPFTDALLAELRDS
ncbi:MAG: hypothetical protein KC425_18445 [Anaerolineales bacterium]|nr:hypothetical protein [Anaerolineales bacterium]